MLAGLGGRDDAAKDREQSHCVEVGMLEDCPGRNARQQLVPLCHAFKAARTYVGLRSGAPSNQRAKGHPRAHRGRGPWSPAPRYR